SFPSRARRRREPLARAIRGRSAMSSWPRSSVVSLLAAATRCASAAAAVRRSTVVFMRTCPCEDEARNGALVRCVAERIRSANLRRRGRDAGAQSIEYRRLAGRGGNEMKRVHSPLLSDPVDAADALLEPAGIPRQLEVDHRAAPVVQIQPLCG